MISRRPLLDASLLTATLLATVVSLTAGWHTEAMDGMVLIGAYLLMIHWEDKRKATK